jgi:hypothetical protein
MFQFAACEGMSRLECRSQIRSRKGVCPICLQASLHSLDPFFQLSIRNRNRLLQLDWRDELYSIDREELAEHPWANRYELLDESSMYLRTRVQITGVILTEPLIKRARGRR